ncbi:hypothetical protein, partial [Vandammella animalimorsus]|uniref:hypothetical protein n=1 Tax=Vandammella animalimorsus TaxID=2029117 RepID=UPI001EED3BF9
VIDWNKVVELFEAEQALGKGVGCAHAALSCSLDGWGRFFSSLLGEGRLGLRSGFSRQKPQMQGKNACKVFRPCKRFQRCSCAVLTENTAAILNLNNS